MSDHRLEWSPVGKAVIPEIAAAVETVEARLVPVRVESDGAPIYEHQLAPLINARDIYLAGFAWDDLKQMYREAR